jgi:hypothetical protein
VDSLFTGEARSPLATTWSNCRGATTIEVLADFPSMLTRCCAAVLLVTFLTTCGETPAADRRVEIYRLDGGR